MMGVMGERRYARFNRRDDALQLGLSLAQPRDLVAQRLQLGVIVHRDPPAGRVWARRARARWARLRMWP